MLFVNCNYTMQFQENAPSQVVFSYYRWLYLYVFYAPQTGRERLILKCLPLLPCQGVFNGVPQKKG